MSQEKDPNTLEVNVNDSVGVKSVFGTPSSGEEKKTEEELKLQLENDLAKLAERKVFLAEQYVEPHHIPARRVKAEDIPSLVEDAKLMHEMCMVGRGDYTNVYAIAHTQINNKDPLRFFVTMGGEVVINPVITSHGHGIVQTREGCMSYPAEPMKQLTRFDSIIMKYRTLSQKVNRTSGEVVGELEMTKEVTTKYKDQLAQIYQNQCQHLNGSYIYDENSSALRAMGEANIDKKLK